MFDSKLGDPDPGRLVSKLHQKPTSRVRNAQEAYARTARLASWLVRLNAMLALVFLGLAVYAHWAFCVLSVAAVIVVMGARAHARANARMSFLLTPLNAGELHKLMELAAGSDVVREAVAKARGCSRELYRADLMYARSIVVREVRNGGRPSDRLPLEQTKGLLSPWAT